MTGTTARLRELLDGPEMVVAPFVFDCLQAKIAEAAGFKAVYMTGFGTAAARGFPDLGLLTMTEMIQNVRAISHAVRVPVICDADTGYGNPINVWRTVREYEDAGAAALHIEDQVWPKKCGFLAGKQVIPMEQMVPKVRAACDARSDPNFVIIARTDALSVNGWDDTVKRAAGLS
jgi:2,3-dimethylmalate lyase